MLCVVASSAGVGGPPRRRRQLANTTAALVGSTSSGDLLDNMGQFMAQLAADSVTATERAASAGRSIHCFLIF
jgi:hypothetical protein